MKNKLKILLFKILDIIPQKLAYPLYHKIQSFSGSITSTTRIKSGENTYNRLIDVCNKLHINLKGNEILEIGSGWSPILPYFFIYKSNVKQVLTYDINEHYQKSTILKLNDDFSKLYGINIDTNKKNKFGLSKNIEYYPLKDLTKIQIPKVDTVFTRYVLSHMLTDDVIKLHKKFKDELPNNTIIVHFISPSDLRQHVDKTLSLQDFLKYSEVEWNNIQTKFNYHNRLRLPQFLEIFDKAGLEVLHLSYDSAKIGSKEYELFKKIDLHKDYSKFSDEELTAGNILVVLKS